MRRFLAGAAVGLIVLLGAALLLGPPGSGRVKAPVALPAEAANQPLVSDQAATDRLLGLVKAQDVAGVAAMLSATQSDSRQARADQRDLFSLFSFLHPDMDSFTRRWLAEDPSSAAAMTARAKYLKDLGWARRGSGFAREIPEPALLAFRAAHAEGLALATAAVKADPTLLPASDAILEMSYTIGEADRVLPEVRRIMALAPNRRTLILAATALAPKWGGSPADILGMCNLFAPEVTDQPGYTPEICVIEGIFSGGPLPGPERDLAEARLADNASPLLDRWRKGRNIVEGDTPGTRRVAFEAIKAKRPLTLDEARLHDQDAQQLGVLAGKRPDPEYPAAVARQVGIARTLADNNPGIFSNLSDYEHAMVEDATVNGTAFAESGLPDMPRRYRQHLSIALHTPQAWSRLGTQLAQTNPDRLAGLETAEPYLINAIVFSNHGKEQLSLALSMKLSEMVQAMQAADPPADTERFHRVVQCPLVRQMRLLLAQCRKDEEDFSTCTGGLPYEAEAMDALIKDIAYAGACPMETAAPMADLFYAPHQIDLTEP